MLYKIKFNEEEKSILKEVYAFAKASKIRLYLVGGILRDKALGLKKSNLDFDFCLKDKAIAFGKKLSRKLRCGFVILDKENGACRLVKKTQDSIYTLDFTDFRGKDLEDDLVHRDFTINSMALDLKDASSDIITEDSIIDACSSRKDLEKGLICSSGNNVFTDDPLRILRAFSLASILNFKIDDATLKLAQKHRKMLLCVSGERIRDEIFKILDTSSAYSCFCLLDKLKILEVIFPEIKKMRGVGQGPYHHLDAWQHTLESIKQLEAVFLEFKKNEDIRIYLNDPISSQRKRDVLLKLGALLHDMGKPAALRRQGKKIIFHGHERIGLYITREIVKRLKLSNDELNSLLRIVLHHLRPGYLSDAHDLTERAIFRFFRDTAEDAVGILLLSIADQRATKGRLATKESRMRQEKTAKYLIKEYFRRKKEKKPPRLVTGDDLMLEFKLSPSVLIGKILFELEELQAIGKIKDKKEALCAAKRILNSLRNKSSRKH